MSRALPTRDQFIQALESYQAAREREVPAGVIARNHYRTRFFGINWGYSAEEKIDAAKLLLRSLRGEKVNFSERHLEALNNSTLGVIVGAHSHLLPVDYKRQEKVRIIRGMNLMRR